MLRNKQGTWSFFQIALLYRRDETKEWSFGFTYPHGLNPTDYGFPKNLSFSASGDVWQEIGQHGTYDRDYAVVACRKIAMEYPQHKFKVVKRTVTQAVEDMKEFD